MHIHMVGQFTQYLNPCVCGVGVTWKINYKEERNDEKMNKRRRERK